MFKNEKGFYCAGNKKELQNIAKTIYKEHHELVRRVCPNERLLEFDLKEGCDPLRAFLGKEKPEVPFPRLNERASLAERSKGFQKASILNVLRNLALIVAFVGVTLFAVGWVRR